MTVTIIIQIEPSSHHGTLDEACQNAERCARAWARANWFDVKRLVVRKRVRTRIRGGRVWQTVTAEARER